MGASGSRMVSHALATLTSRMAFRDTFLSDDLDPSVATSLVALSALASYHDTRCGILPDRGDAVLARREDCEFGQQLLLSVVDIGTGTFVAVEHDGEARSSIAQL